MTVHLRNGIQTLKLQSCDARVTQPGKCQEIRWVRAGTVNAGIDGRGAVGRRDTTVLRHTHLGEDGLLREFIQLHLRDRGVGAGVGALQAAPAAGPGVDRTSYQLSQGTALCLPLSWPCSCFSP